MPSSPSTFKPRFALTPKVNARQYDDARGNANARGYTYAWSKVRRMKLTLTPLCEDCERDGRVTIASVVHHKREITDYPEGRLELDNLESVCPMHHQLKHHAR